MTTPDRSLRRSGADSSVLHDRSVLSACPPCRACDAPDVVPSRARRQGASAARERHSAGTPPIANAQPGPMDQYWHCAALCAMVPPAHSPECSMEELWAHQTGSFAVAA